MTEVPLFLFNNALFPPKITKSHFFTIYTIFFIIFMSYSTLESIELEDDNFRNLQFSYIVIGNMFISRYIKDLQFKIQQ